MDPRKFYEDRANGCAYFFDNDGELMSAPMQIDGQPDWYCAIYVCDFAEPPMGKELERITEKTTEASK